MGKLDTAVSPAWTKRPAPNKEIGCEGTLGKLTQVHAALCGTPMSELCSMPQYKVCWKGSVNPNFSQETEELINSCRKRTIVVDKNLEMDLTFDCAMCLDDGDGCPNIQYSMINAANDLGSPELFIIQITRADGVRIIGYASVTGFSMDGIADDDNSIVTDTVTLSFQDEFEVLPKDQKCIDWHGVAFLDAGFQTALAGFDFLDENGNGLVAGDSTGFFPANPTAILPWYDDDVTTSINSANGEIIDYTIGEGCELPPVCQI